MLALFYTIHVLICIALIVVVLLQTGKGVGLASVFGAGGGGADTLFGSRGFGGMLAKVTGVMAVLFMVSSIGLSLAPRGGGEEESVIERLQRPGTEMPVQPGQVPGQQPAQQPLEPQPEQPGDQAPSGTPADQTPVETSPAGE